MPIHVIAKKKLKKKCMHARDQRFVFHYSQKIQSRLLTCHAIIFLVITYKPKVPLYQYEILMWVLTKCIHFF